MYSIVPATILLIIEALNILSPYNITLGRLLDLHETNELLGDSRNYMPPILVPSSAKRIATQVVVTAKLNGRKDFILRGFVCHIIRPSKESPVQS